MASPFGREPVIIQECLSSSAESVSSPDTACYAPADADRQDTFVPDESTAMPPPFF